MAPGSIFHHITFRSTILFSYLLPLQSFTFRSINQKYQKYYFTVYPSLSDLTFQITVKGLIPWFSKLREILTLLCCITLSSSREKPTQAQEVAQPTKKWLWGASIYSQ